MVDEKCIASQGNDHKDLMVKEVIIHEGFKKYHLIRNKLINPRKILVHNEKIYLMGDEGVWISDGRYESSGLDYSIFKGVYLDPL